MDANLLKTRDAFYLSSHNLSFKKIAKTQDVPIGTMLKVKLNEKDILIANVDGQYYAMDSICSHKKGDLSKGTLEGKVVVCPVHGSRFNVTNGKNIQGPKAFLSRGKTEDINIYELKIDGDDILIFVKSTWGM